MNPVELIQKILQALDQREQEKDLPNANRMKQIDDVNRKTITQYSNSPDERYADADAVTTKAGGGINYAKHPADIRANSVAVYPEFKGFKDYYNELQQRQTDPHADMIDVMNKDNQ